MMASGGRDLDPIKLGRLLSAVSDIEVCVNSVLSTSFAP